MSVIIFKNKKDYIERIVNGFFPMFVKILIDNNILELLKSDLPSQKKQKICIELSDMCNDLMFGYKNKKYKSLILGMNKAIGFKRNISGILK